MSKIPHIGVTKPRTYHGEIVRYVYLDDKIVAVLRKHDRDDTTDAWWWNLCDFKVENTQRNTLSAARKLVTAAIKTAYKLKSVN